MSKHKHRTIIVISLTLIIFLTSECSVFEERSFCPCWVGLDFSTVLAQDDLAGAEDEAIELSVFDSNGQVAYCHTYGLDSCASRYEVEIPRGLYTVSAVIRRQENAQDLNQDIISIGTDRQADTIYGKSLCLDAGNETAEAVIEPFKQYSSIDIRILSSPFDSLNISIMAASAAIDRKTLEGLPRQYSCTGTFSGDRAGFNILRQTGGELRLSFSDTATGRHITDIDLGLWLNEIGYDFSAESLADIVLILDFYKGTASLSIAGWLDAPVYHVIF